MPRRRVTLFAALLAAPLPAMAQSAAQSDARPDSQPATRPAAATSATATAATDGWSWRNDRPVLSIGNGGFTLSPLVRFDVDGALFVDQDRGGRAAGFEDAANLRRGRLGVRGTVLDAFEYNFTWDLGGNPATSNALFEASLGWTGLGWGTIRAGAFTLQHLPEYAGSSFDLPFLERASVTAITASLASGVTRLALGLEARGDRWNASGYVTGQVLSTRSDDRARGLVGRAVALLPELGPVRLQIGLDGTAQFAPGTSPGPDTLRLRDYPELRGANSNRFLDTGGMRTDTAWAIGPELAGRIGPVYVEALYQHIGVELTGGGSRGFDGGYVTAVVPLVGPPRERNRSTGTWARPKTRGWIDPANGNWGALELAGRYSVVDLRDGPTRGGRQRIWTGGLTWHLSPNLRLQAQYENGSIALDGPDRSFQAVGLRASFNL
ncbi:OprO/OprP family phosphate-selective porin [Roseomonas sp. NAR14]|uniref:OprO/OprP family phosphate-selective porin n=1 Tax=Roseomonas acroporae TaxID=2937791 RepID=A0A9X2BS47_9PROT|nr:porin [Roseomonas acroporae]MCK8783238.1 OprO/OprP family phosphate-selective porin [Roseomonas acroporae]